MFLVVRSLKYNNEKVDYEIMDRDILKIGRVKFAVKEIGYAPKPEKKEGDDKEGEAEDKKEEEKVEKGHSSNSKFTDSKDEEFEEYSDVHGILK